MKTKVLDDDAISITHSARVNLSPIYRLRITTLSFNIGLTIKADTFKCYGDSHNGFCRVEFADDNNEWHFIELKKEIAQQIKQTIESKELESE